MLDSAAYPQLRAKAAPALPIEQMIVGQSVKAAAELLPRLFNLCRVAQGIAARAAFDLPLGRDWQEELRREILREHIVKLCLKLPAALNQPALPLPRDWIEGHREAREDVFGPGGQLPETAQGFAAFLSAGKGIASVLRPVTQLFGEGEAVRDALPLSAHQTIFDNCLQENSVAARQAQHPVLQSIEAAHGRNLLWSVTALAYDLQALWDGQLPASELNTGRAVVPAARGYYGVHATVEAGRVASFRRVTPTDHLLAPRGALEQSLTSLPRQKAQALAPLVLSILDPCHPVSLVPKAEEEATRA